MLAAPLFAGASPLWDCGNSFAALAEERSADLRRWTQMDADGRGWTRIFGKDTRSGFRHAAARGTRFVPEDKKRTRHSSTPLPRFQKNLRQSAKICGSLFFRQVQSGLPSAKHRSAAFNVECSMFGAFAPPRYYLSSRHEMSVRHHLSGAIRATIPWPVRRESCRLRSTFPGNRFIAYPSSQMAVNLIQDRSPAELKKEITGIVEKDLRALPGTAKIFAAVARLQKFDRLPEIADPARIDESIAEGCKELQRGISPSDGVPAELYARELIGGTLHPGTKIAYGHGHLSLHAEYRRGPP
jgi:hypothetical protein